MSVQDQQVLGEPWRVSPSCCGDVVHSPPPSDTAAPPLRSLLPIDMCIRDSVLGSR